MPCYIRIHSNTSNIKMNISNILKENLESFYPWSDNDTPPLDTNKKTFVEKERENDEFFEGWRASM